MDPQNPLTVKLEKPGKDDTVDYLAVVFVIVNLGYNTVRLNVVVLSCSCH